MNVGEDDYEMMMNLVEVLKYILTDSLWLFFN